jgi:two-component system CheB/CheR fusion protein
LKAVKEKGGLVIVQDPEEAAFDGMPRSAILGGGADLVLVAAKMPQALVRYARQTYVKVDLANVRPSDTVQEAFAGIIDLLAAKTPHDFSLYKQGTLQRRIARRMAMGGYRERRTLLAGSA